MKREHRECPECAAMGLDYLSFGTSVALEILAQSAFHGGQIFHDIPEDEECDPRDNVALREAIFYNVRQAVLTTINRSDTMRPDWDDGYEAGYEALRATFEFLEAGDPIDGDE